jgi:hypothetical protein
MFRRVETLKDITRASSSYTQRLLPHHIVQMRELSYGRLRHSQAVTCESKQNGVEDRHFITPRFNWGRKGAIGTKRENCVGSSVDQIKRLSEGFTTRNSRPRKRSGNKHRHVKDVGQPGDHRVEQPRGQMSNTSQLLLFGF